MAKPVGRRESAREPRGVGARRVQHHLARDGQIAIEALVTATLSQRDSGTSAKPRQRERGLPLMAYCPLDQGALVDAPALRAMAARHAATPSQIALAWLMAQRGVMVIPKAVQASHLRDNLAAAELRLNDADREAIEQHFAAPRRKVPLAMR